MRRNSGIIGSGKFVNLNSASGVHDIFDGYSARLDNVWPKTKKFVSITPNSGNSNEGDTINFTTVVDGFEDGNTIYYNIDQVNGTIESSDFTDGALSGSLTVNNNTASFTKTLVFDGTSEPGDTFKVNIRKDSVSGLILGSSGNIEINNPSFSITPSSSSFNEGSSVTWNVTTTNVNNGTVLYYSYIGTPANSDDISSPLSGSFTINNNQGSFTTTAVDDFITEGNETLTARVHVGSTGGAIVASDTVTINDTSLTPSATITPSTLTPSEGQGIIVNVTTTNIPDGTTLYMTVENVSNGEPADDFDTSQFTVSITSGSGSNVIATIADGYTEGSESFEIKARLDSYDGRVIGTSSTITISDTSTGTPEPQGEDLSSAFFSIAEFVNNDNASDTTSNYSVSEIQQGFSGTGRLYLIHKAAGTGESSFYYDAPVACIQVLNSSGTVVNQQWWFGTSGNPAGWQTHTQEYNLGGLGAGIYITPSQAASNYAYQNIVNGATADRFNLATSTGSSGTGAVGGIPEPTGPMTLGEKTMPQIDSAYYMYREMSGGTNNYSALCRSPSRTWSAGERIRIAYIIGNRPSLNAYQADDTFFVGIA